MGQLLLKAAVSGAIVALASEAVRRSSLAGAVLVSLPLTSILALAWLHLDTHDAGKVTDLSWAILWIVGPSLVFFAALPLLIRAGMGVYAGYVVTARRLGTPL